MFRRIFGSLSDSSFGDVGTKGDVGEAAIEVMYAELARVHGCEYVGGGSMGLMLDVGEYEY